MNNHGFKIGSKFGALAVTAVAIAGCTEISKNQLYSQIPPSAKDGTSLRKVCGLNGGTSAGPRNGLVATLRFLDETQPHYLDVASYLRAGHLVEANIFMNRLDVMTRMFSEGFATTSGEVLTNSQGQPLYEYFSLSFRSNLKWAAGGVYQLAVLSDDGAVISLADSSGSYSTHIDNDGGHPTRMGCTANVVDLSGNRRIPIKVDYFQGPRYHIALNLIWREITAEGTSATIDPLCGYSSNDQWFDPGTVPSTPAAGWMDLRSRGWNFVPAEAFELPSEASDNPCL